MGKHVAALGFLYALFGLFTATLGVAVLIVGLGAWGGLIREILDIVGWGHLAKWMGAGFGSALVASGTICLVTAFGLWARKGWGRFLGLLGGASQLLTFSWPALLGVYTGWVLLSNDGQREFKKHRR